MIDDKFGWLQWIDQSRVARKALHSVAHGSEIDYRGHAGKVLQQHAAGSEGDFFVGLRVPVPGSQGANVVGFYVAAIFGAQQVFQKYSKRIGKMAGRNAQLVECVETVNFVVVIADGERGAGLKAVHWTGLPELTM